MAIAQKDLESIKQTFKQFDTDGTGVIRKDQCMSLFKDLVPWPEEDIAYFFDAAPVDLDDAVNYNEFVEWIFKGATVAPAAKVPSKSKVVLTPEEEEEERRRIAKGGGAKRKSICGESINEDQIKNYKAPSYPKSDDAQAKIRDALMKNEKMNILGIERLNTADLEEMIMAFQERNVSQDEDVIKQGDTGDCLYIVDEGTFDIFVARKNDDDTLGAPVKVTNYGPGWLFGELALMYSAPRAATVKCATPTARLWSLDRQPFNMLLKRCGVQMVEQYSGWLTTIEIFKQLNTFEIGKVADASESILLDEDEVICEQGAEGDAFFILEDGQCAAFIDDKMVMSYTKPGEYFGELALLNNEPRKATVKATVESAVLRIEKQVFDDVLMPLHQYLQTMAASKYPST